MSAPDPSDVDGNIFFKAYFGYGVSKEEARTLARRTYKAEMLVQQLRNEILTLRAESSALRETIEVLTDGL